jgi:hypothetical protein
LTRIPYLRTLAWGTAALFTTVAALVAVAFPLHASDALTFGEWSRLIAEHWSHAFEASTRPLFYVVQGSLWWLIGYSDTSGRLLSGLFGLVLPAALAWLLADRPWGRVAAVLVVLFVLATPVYAYQIVSSLTDVFVASLIAATAALATRPLRRWLPAVTGFTAMLAVLAKPSAVLALVGIAASLLLVVEPLRDRLLRRVLPVFVGMCTGFAYYVVQAHRVHSDVRSFVEAGVTSPYWSHLAAQTRRSAVLDFGWFGDALRSVVIFTLFYTIARLVGARHRATVLAAVPSVVFFSWFLPWVGAGETRVDVGAFANPSSVVAFLVTSAALVAAVWAPESAIPTRRELLQFTLWVALPLVSWMRYATYDGRLLSPAWPGLLALMAVCTTPAVASLARVPVAALAPVAGVIIAVAFNIYNIDGLQRSGWDQWRRTPSSARFNVEATRAIVLPDLSKVLAVARPLMGKHGRMLTPEGAFRFFFPGRVDQAYATSCAQLSPYRVFVLTLDAGTRDYMEHFLHVSADPRFWAGCRRPKTRFLPSGALGYAAFSVGS